MRTIIIERNMAVVGGGPTTLRELDTYVHIYIGDHLVMGDSVYKVMHRKVDIDKMETKVFVDQISK